MITIKNPVAKGRYYKLSDLLNVIFRKEHGMSDTFIGSCGGYYGLFLISYNTFVYLENPIKNWDSSDSEFLVEKFVDIEITIK